MSGSKRRSSIFKRMIVPLILLVLVEALLMFAVFARSNMYGRLRSSAESILRTQVASRADYLASSLNSLSGLSPLSARINVQAQAMSDSGELDLGTGEDVCDRWEELLLSVSGDLADTLRTKNLTGIFLMIYTEDNSRAEDGAYIATKPGVYIRNAAQTGSASGSPALLLEYGPEAITQTANVSAALDWRPGFYFPHRGDMAEYDCLAGAIEDAGDGSATKNADALGRWRHGAVPIEGADGQALIYSVPLLLDDGTVYGVLGVELLDSRVQEMLGYSELSDSGEGAYILASAQAEPILLSGSGAPAEAMALDGENGGKAVFDDGRDYCLTGAQVNVRGGEWLLIGAVPEGVLYGFTDQVISLLLRILLVMLLVGILGSYLISGLVARPIKRLSNEVSKTKFTSGTIPELPETGIREIDRFSGAIMRLSRDIVESSARFLKIIQFNSVDMGAFELNYDSDKIFISGSLMELLGIQDYPLENLTASAFLDILEGLQSQCVNVSDTADIRVYKFTNSDGSSRYVRVQKTALEDRLLGVVEDVTESTEENLRVSYERDHDVLTGLKNRRAFFEQSEALFKKPEALKYSALLMLDLDDLKQTNDTYGHDCGDGYLSAAADCFERSTPENGICARLSGDEFVLLLYGFESAGERQQALDSFSESLRDMKFTLPDGEAITIRASGGVALYPEDSEDLNQLKKFADFAMYRIKLMHRSGSGIESFDLGLYNLEAAKLQKRQELDRLLSGELLVYFFQPIVSAADGSIFAYEALIRSQVPIFTTADDIVATAKDAGRLQDLEVVTWLKAPAFYRELYEKNLTVRDAVLFINMIGSETLPGEAIEKFRSDFADVPFKIVLELTEAGGFSAEAFNSKLEVAGELGFALDDFGSGYNVERRLVELSPKFIKVDSAMVRNVDSDANKRQLIGNIIEYAHQRDMLIIAEGVETGGEMRAMIDMGCDLLQGFFLAHPAPVPEHVSDDALRIISEMRQ